MTVDPDFHEDVINGGRARCGGRLGVNNHFGAKLCSGELVGCDHAMEIAVRSF
jgi:hypothetical protein